MERRAYPEVRIPQEDKLLQDNASAVASVMCKTMPDEDKHKLSKMSEDLESELSYIEEIKYQIFEKLEEMGIDLWHSKTKRND